VGITLRMVINMITRVVPLTDTAVGITRTCTIGIVSPFTAAAISAASLVKNHRGVDLISDVLPFGRCGMTSQTPSAMQSVLDCPTNSRQKAEKPEW